MTHIVNQDLHHYNLQVCQFVEYLNLQDDIWLQLLEAVTKNLTAKVEQPVYDFN